MRIIAAVIAVLACACQDNSGYKLPVNPGGGGFGGGGGGFGDAGSTVDAPDGGPRYRVCLLESDFRALDVCAPAGAGHFTVTLGSGADMVSATTSDDGSFAIIPPGDSNMLWNVTGDTIFPTTMAYDGIHNTIPAGASEGYSGLSDGNSASFNTGDGAVFMVVADSSNMGKPLMGATATISPDNSGFEAFYDNPGSASVWNHGTTTSTGSAGTIWFPNVPPDSGAATVSLTASMGDTPGSVTVPIVAETLTMVFVSVTP